MPKTLLSKKADKIEDENKMLRKRNKELNDVMGFMWILNLVFYIIGVGVGWCMYVPK